MRNPTRRNRNIGTPKQGHGKDNKLVVPYPAVEMKSFYERLGKYTTIHKQINGHSFRFVIESTRSTSFHACTIEDIEKMLLQIPKEDYGDLELIILRQPTRKEESLKTVWGRLIYAYEFEDECHPAVIIEAADFSRTLKWSKKLNLESQQELKRLKEDGHEFKMTKRHHEAPFEIENVRSTQLYRTLPHEFGHYVHYLQVVEFPGKEDEEWEEWEKRWDAYHALPTSEKEVFAHAYADKLKLKLEKLQAIPFERIISDAEMKKNKLNLSDFIPPSNLQSSL